MENLLTYLPYIPADDYDTWLKVGMALKHEGFSLTDWESWSKKSQKYKPGICERKWNTFKETAAQVVAGGTIFEYARQYGYSPPTGAFDWDDSIHEPTEQKIPEMRDEPIEQLRKYLRKMFKPDEYVGYCDKLTFDEKQNKWIPRDGLFKRTAGQLLEDLESGFELSTIRGESEGGAMIRFNPLDGNGQFNTNVTDRRYCLFESDTESIERQYQTYMRLKLPIVCLVNSGNKSLHAIIHVDAGRDKRLYDERVRKIYSVCEKNGLTPDEQDKNESRYSRMPGIKRGDKYQYVVAWDIGFKSFSEWEAWIDSQELDDGLPEAVDFYEVSLNPPPLKEELIEGILRAGHKLLISGPSKAMKSFMLINLAVCLSTGKDWLGHKCKQGKVLYINLELDDSSCINRFIKVRDALGIDPEKIKNRLTIWNLRGKSVPMDKLAEVIIRRYKNKEYTAIIIDPIYKVMLGDENNATEMGRFCSYFDKVALETKAAMLYCHHHSKGAGMKYSRAADRASGSGVFARDPDAILDLIELEATEEMIARYREKVPGEENVSAWEITATLREFPPMETTKLWFEHPIHIVDEWNFLAEAKEGETKRKAGIGKKQISKADWPKVLRAAYNTVLPDSEGRVEYDAVERYIGATIKNYVKTAGLRAKMIDGVKYLFDDSNS